MFLGKLLGFPHTCYDVYPMIYLEITKNKWILSHEWGFTRLTQNPYDLNSPPKNAGFMGFSAVKSRKKSTTARRWRLHLRRSTSFFGQSDEPERKWWKGEMGLNSGYIMDELWIYLMDIYIYIWIYGNIDMEYMGSSYLWHDHMSYGINIHWPARPLRGHINGQGPKIIPSATLGKLSHVWSIKG